MAEQPPDERALAGAVREHHNNTDPGPAPLRQVDRDRTVAARALDRANLHHDDIAAVCGVRPWQVPAVLRGERV